MQFFVVLEKFTCASLFQIALEIIRLPIQIAQFLTQRFVRLPVTVLNRLKGPAIKLGKFVECKTKIIFGIA